MLPARLAWEALTAKLIVCKLARPNMTLWRAPVPWWPFSVGLWQTTTCHRGSPDESSGHYSDSSPFLLSFSYEDSCAWCSVSNVLSFVSWGGLLTWRGGGHTLCFCGCSEVVHPSFVLTFQTVFFMYGKWSTHVCVSMHGALVCSCMSQCFCAPVVCIFKRSILNKSDRGDWESAKDFFSVLFQCFLCLFSCY